MIQQAFSRHCLLYLILEDAHLVFYIFTVQEMKDKMWSQVEEVKSDGGTTDEEGLTVSGRRKYHIYIISRLK